eukprot:CAMPEP_0117550104 /NCGR_PEP_ID=MMETSP0784-20121206/48507_1 /TAXON_ID=39447 /ORGANISM="" /LENGTH=289 /DNA_ID=CAMNT_0005347109 /DNA_START=28 /DNA_END=897 /DNA_ORIENTATION=+
MARGTAAIRYNAPRKLLIMTIFAGFLGAAYGVDDDVDADPEADAADLDDAPSDEPAAEESASADEAGLSPEESYLRQSKDVLGKLKELKTLLAEKADKVGPEHLEQLKAVEEMLEGLKMPTQGQPDEKALTEIFGACVLMTMHRAGYKRPSTQSALRSMALGKVTPAQAAESDFWRMAVACINGITDAELESFKAGGLKLLPKSHVTASQEKDFTDQVLKLDAAHWDFFKAVAKEFAGEVESSGGASHVYGLAAGAVIVLVAVILTRKVIDMRRGSDKKDKAGKKKKQK